MKKLKDHISFHKHWSDLSNDMFEVNLIVVLRLKSRGYFSSWMQSNDALNWLSEFDRQAPWNPCKPAALIFKFDTFGADMPLKALTCTTLWKDHHPVITLLDPLFLYTHNMSARNYMNHDKKKDITIYMIKWEWC